MKEIEVKAKVKNSDLLLKRLKELGTKLSDPVSQNDIVYAFGDWESNQSINDRNILRIRQEDGRALLTLKRPGINELDSREEESEVSNPNAVEAMLLLMNYREVVRVSKVRRTANHEGMQICLDEVRGLGTFVEVERMVDEGNTEAIQEELFQFLEQSGISRDQRVLQGYDSLVKLKNETIAKAVC